MVNFIIALRDDNDDNSLVGETITIDAATTLLDIDSHLQCCGSKTTPTIRSSQHVSRPLIIRNSSHLGLLLTICRRFFGVHGEEINLEPFAAHRAFNVPCDVQSVGIWRKTENNELVSPGDSPELSVKLLDDTMGLDIDCSSSNQTSFLTATQRPLGTSATSETRVLKE